MIPILLQVTVSLTILILGVGCLKSDPRAVAKITPIRRFFKAFLGEDYEIPDLTIGIGLVLIGLLALFNTFMMFAAKYEFWVV